MHKSADTKKLAHEIKSRIDKATSILLHCHPSPDPDSVGSALAMKFALEQMGKKATVIKGDSEFPLGFEHFPGATDIVHKNFFEVDLSAFDLFIVLDSADSHRISMRGDVVFPKGLSTIAIDHHKTNPNFCDINLVDSDAPATGQILFELFKEWGVELTREIASNLFIGIYTDTGGFKYNSTSVRTFEIATELVKHIPDHSSLIFEMENSNHPGFITFQGLAFSNVKLYLKGNMAVSSVSFDQIKEKNIDLTEVHSSEVSPFLRSVIGWNIGVAMIEVEPLHVKVSFRTRDHVKFDVAKLAAELGGGGHVSAAGATLKMSLDEAVKKVVETASKMYNLQENNL